MTKGDLVSAISERSGIEKETVSTVIEHYFKEVKDSMADGNNIYIRGFGTFEIVKRKSKVGRDFKHKSAIPLPAHNIPRFKPAESFKNRISKNLPISV